MKQIKYVLLIGALAVGMCACKNNSEDKDEEDIKIATTANVTTEATTEVITEAATEAITETTTEAATEATAGATTDVTVESKTEEDMDVVMLVNLRGDHTTVYRLADGRYMDRVDMVYTYDGKDAWFDENGVEWNRTAEAPNE